MLTIYLVIPCYNEEDVLKETANCLKVKLESLKNKSLITNKSRIIFVDDGSTDSTWSIIKELYGSDMLFGGISLSTNRGHQNALLAGLMTVKKYCDAVITMDADLQDDIGVIEDMITEASNGYDIVYGVRSVRILDSYFKRKSAELFYKLMGLLGANIIYNHADYRLMSKRALDGLEQFQEVNIFLRGIVPMIGYPSTTVYYERKKRFAGKSKYPLKRMIAFALEGITSLSTKPIRIITVLGGAMVIVSAIMLLWSIIGAFKGTTVVGWASIMVSIWGIGGIIMFSLGVVGEYIGKIYLETKHRPRYLIKEELLIIDDKMN